MRRRKGIKKRVEVKVPKKTTGMLPVGDDAAASVSFSLRVRAGRRECEA